MTLLEQYREVREKLLDSQTPKFRLYHFQHWLLGVLANRNDLPRCPFTRLSLTGIRGRFADYGVLRREQFRAFAEDLRRLQEHMAPGVWDQVHEILTTEEGALS